MASLDPVDALSNGLLPWRRAGAAVVVLSAVPSRAVVHLARLKAAFGTDVRIARAEPVALEKALLRFAARPLVLRAEARCPGPASCRSLPWNKLCRWFTCGFLALAAVSFATPILIFACLAGIGGFVLLAMAGLRLAAVVALLRRDTRDDGAAVMPARPPMISLLVPLYRESEIAGTLLARMAELDYPRDRLELCLIVEDDDLQTRRTLEMSDLPEWARIIEVPEGSLRTKPRALNYAMAFAQGSIIGVYDAEDSPAPDHLRRVAEVFARREPTTACLQGALDYFNCDRTWVARCFTLEYASWFRVLLPGIERLGLALPLGGTTLFLRREALEAVGGWDAHNVTEDADLGIRLARQGYRTEIIPVSTVEEATTRIWPWIRQRSRWLKGYAVTWAVHMRDPRALWRDLGPRRFLGFQLMFAGTLLQFALAPVLWSFWLVPLGLPHPLAQVLSPALLVALSILFLASQILDLAFAVLGTHRAGKANLSIWAPVLIPYFIMATVALYRAAWQLVWQPFQWDKTAHGLDRPPVTLAPAARLPIIVRTGAWRRRAGGES
jgi:cellulose synthase/poly-beta-1,6-N-acetylglucosamine synthase-like glycosyltransferase